MPDSGREREPTDHTPRHEAGQNSGQTQTTTTVKTLSATELAGEPDYSLIIAVKTQFSAESGFWHLSRSRGRQPMRVSSP